MFFDKTGTLTHGEPTVTETLSFSGAGSTDVLCLAASLEQYSKHPLAGAILHAAEERNIALQHVENISEKPGEGLKGHIAGRKVLVTGRRKLAPEMASVLPAATSGMECVVVVDGQYSACSGFMTGRGKTADLLSVLRRKPPVL
jgi:cation transport ATPase